MFRANASVYRVRADCFFHLEGLLVRSEVLGACLRFQRCDADIEIRFPSEDDHEFSALSGETTVHPRRPPIDIATTTIQSRAFFSCLRASCGRITSPPEEIDEKVHAIANEVITEFIEWHRLRGQSWLGLHGQPPRWLTLPCLIDEDTGDEPTYEIVIPASEILEHPDIVALAERVRRQFTTAVDSQSLTEMVNAITQSERPGLAEQILADALYFGDRSHPELPRALLFAAIACELKVKQTLRSKAPAEKRELVEVLLENPRDFSMPVAGLFDKALDATLGYSLKQRDRSLFNRIEKLFQLRNRIAHHGKVPADSSIDCLRAASQVFSWLDEVTST